MNQPSATAIYFSQAIATSGLKQSEIARRVGLARPNIISMWKNDDSKIPLERIPALARACGKDPKEMLEIAMREYQPEIWGVLKEAYKL